MTKIIQTQPIRRELNNQQKIMESPGKGLFTPKVLRKLQQVTDHSEAVTRRYSVKKKFLKFFKIHKKTLVPGSLF